MILVMTVLKVPDCRITKPLNYSNQMYLVFIRIICLVCSLRCLDSNFFPPFLFLFSYKDITILNFLIDQYMWKYNSGKLL